MQLLSYGSCNHIIVPSVVEFKEAVMKKMSACQCRITVIIVSDYSYPALASRHFFQVMGLECKIANVDHQIPLPIFQTEKALLISTLFHVVTLFSRLAYYLNFFAYV